MKNNNGKGLYEIGEESRLPCGCITIAEVVGYTHYINPGCTFDNKMHSKVPNYNYRRWEERPSISQ